jgi:ankyrin repeat protein
MKPSKITLLALCLASTTYAALGALNSAQAEYGGSYSGSYYSSPSANSYSYRGSSQGSPAVISLELNAQASLNSSLRVAAREERLKDLQRFVAQGGEINSQSETGTSALMYAARNCSLKEVRYLIDAKANVNLKDSRGRTALIYAASNSCVPVVKALLEVPEVEIKAKDHEGKLATDYARSAISLEVGGPASETISAIRAAERAARKRAVQTRRS